MKITTGVAVHCPERGSVWVAAGEVPEWAEPLISNPDIREFDTEPAGKKTK